MNPTITLTLQANGELRLQANVDNPILLYGLLERGKDLVRQSNDERAKGPQIIPAEASALAGLNR